MAPFSVNTQNQPKVWINGEYRPATLDSNGKWYVEIDGKRVEVDPNDLFGMNSNITETPQNMIDFYEEQLTKNDEKKDYLQALGDSIKENLKSAKDKYNSLLSSLGVKSFREINDSAQYTEAQEQYRNIAGLKKDKISNSNRYYSACMRSFDLALDKGDWANQLALAEGVSRTFGLA